VAAVAAAVVVADVVSKQWATAALRDGPIVLVGEIRLALTSNKAAAFGLGGAFVPFLAVGALVLVLVMVTTGSATEKALVAVALGLILGGAFGNVIDRIFRAPGFLRGSVVDFVDLGFWPVFNLADSAITCGCLLLLWASWAKE
jgi:signal peptidase II